MNKKIRYRCVKCKVECFYAPGIGEYCPKCGNDYGLEKINKRMEIKNYEDLKDE